MAARTKPDTREYKVALDPNHPYNYAYQVLNVRFHRVTHRELKEAAAKRGLSMKALVIAGLKLLLDKHEVDFDYEDELRPDVCELCGSKSPKPFHYHKRHKATCKRFRPNRNP